MLPSELTVHTQTVHRFVSNAMRQLIGCDNMRDIVNTEEFNDLCHSIFSAMKIKYEAEESEKLKKSPELAALVEAGAALSAALAGVKDYDDSTNETHADVNYIRFKWADPSLWVSSGTFSVSGNPPVALTACGDVKIRLERALTVLLPGELPRVAQILRDVSEIGEACVFSGRLTSSGDCIVLAEPVAARVGSRAGTWSGDLDGGVVITLPGSSGMKLEFSSPFERCTLDGVDVDVIDNFLPPSSPPHDMAMFLSSKFKSGSWEHESVLQRLEIAAGITVLPAPG